MAVDSAGTFNRLQRTCKLLVLLCLLHISVTVVFYIRSLDNPFAFAQNQQSRNGSAPPDRHLEGFTRAAQQPEEEQQQQEKQLKDEPQEKLEKCPDTSPLLGKSHSRSTHAHTHTEQLRSREIHHDGEHLNASSAFREKLPKSSWNRVTHS